MQKGGLYLSLMRVAPPADDWPPLRCTACATEAPLDTPAYRCPNCGAPWTWDLPSPAFPRAAIEARPPTLWRYAEALPRFARVVSLGEPVTPLVELDPPDGAAGVRLLAKVEGLQPTGSYKDRGSALLVSL